VPDLLWIGTMEGAKAIGVSDWADVEADLTHPSLAGVPADELPAALVFGCGADVLV
jgi:hypothetical protein